MSNVNLESSFTRLPNIKSRDSSNHSTYRGSESVYAVQKVEGKKEHMSIIKLIAKINNASRSNG